jgi:hypothetical protein
VPSSYASITPPPVCFVQPTTDGVHSAG